jgi:UDP-glucose 4-epimerase
VTIKQFAEKAIALTESTREIKYIPHEEAYGEDFEDIRRRVPSLEKAKRHVGYEPTRTLDQIINDVAEQFRVELKSETANA